MTTPEDNLVSPSLQDGCNGARDHTILTYWAGPQVAGTALKTVNVQCNAKNRDLLKRAGFQRCVTHKFYRVPVSRDRLNRLQIAPVSPAAISDSGREVALL